MLHFVAQWNSQSLRILVQMSDVKIFFFRRQDCRVRIWCGSPIIWVAGIRIQLPVLTGTYLGILVGRLPLTHGGSLGECRGPCCSPHQCRSPSPISFRWVPPVRLCVFCILVWSCSLCRPLLCWWELCSSSLQLVVRRNSVSLPALLPNVSSS